MRELVPDRLARHLIHRLQHACYRDVVEAAFESRLLIDRPVFVDGFAIGRPKLQNANGPNANNMIWTSGTRDPVHDLRTLKTRFGTAFDYRPADAEALRVSPANDQSDGLLAQLSSLPERDYLLALLQRFQAPPDIGDLAICLLLGRALQRSGWSAAQFFALLHRPGPLLVIRSDVDGFVPDLLRLIEGRRFIDRTIRVTRMINRSPQKAQRLRYDPENKILDYAFSTITPRCSGMLAGFRNDLIGEALARGETIVAFLASDEELPPALAAATDLTLELGVLDTQLLNQLMQLRAWLDHEPSLTGPDLLDRLAGTTQQSHKAKLKKPRGRPVVLPPDFSLTSIPALRLALRSGRSRSEWIKALKKQACAERSDEHEPRDQERAARQASNHDRRPKLARGVTQAKPVAPPISSNLIQPEPVPELTTDLPASTSKSHRRPIPTIETLAGFGKAKDWALALKDDLVDWKAHTLDWSAMSTDLLLSGPPGTGKTTFARALCNSLQIPLLASSVASWLQAGHLGDVLARIETLFEEARVHAPCILFIDELDGIGTRHSGSSTNATYSNNVINRLLEALDGLNKIDGVVIIGASNRPDAIDPALLRSGRLETHIQIEKPDTDALVAIMAHHLGSDLPAIVASAPLHPPSYDDAPDNAASDHAKDEEAMA